MRAFRQRSCLWVAALLVLAGSCHAQSTGATPDQEYQKLIQVDQNIEPLGEHPFGENISTYDGSLSFNVTDVTLRGNGPTITVGRTAKSFEWAYNLDTNAPVFPFNNWDLDIPRIETLVGTAGEPTTAVWQTGVGGTTPDVGTTNRCTNFAPPPGIQSTLAQGGWVADEWWYGYNLLMPGGGSQQLMPRYSANTLSPTMGGTSFNIVTKNNWMITCGVTASDGGEGFLAIAPDGTRYTFAHLVYRPWFQINGAGGPLPPDGTIIATQTPPAAPQSAMSTKSVAATRTASPMTAGPGGLAILYREEALMYVTQIQDRFGNTLTYNYDSTTGYLTSITANDGREVDVTYVSGSPMIHTITAKAANVSSRTWTYSYAGGLSGVQLPDGSAWSYNGGPGAYNLVLPSNACSANRLPYSNTAPPSQSFGSYSVTTPSGLTGTFSLVIKMSGRSYTPQLCWGQTGSEPPFEIPMAIWPEWSVQPAIASEVISGAGIPTQTWTYNYSAANASWSTDTCASSKTCPTTVYTDVTDPNGNDTRYTFSNVFDSTEGLLLRTDTYSGAFGGTPIRSEINSYANASNGAWPSVYGVDLAYRDNYYQTEQFAPLSVRTIVEDGQYFTWQANAFNAYAQPTDVSRYSNIAGQSSIEEATSYLNDTNLWVLGLPQTVTNVGTGEIESSNTYYPSDLLNTRSHFGEFMMSYIWNSAGQLASFTDGNNHTTSLNNYYRGIPQSIAYPDGHSQSLVVDDLSEISSITDQAGYTTQYSYNPIGRVTQVNYPTNDPNGVSWFAKNISYNYVTSAERGIAAGHWDSVATIGNAVTTMYFDADLRPVLSDTAINGIANSDITTATAYDYTGAKTFVSYPVSGAPDITTVTTGTHHTYDALERVTQTQEDSELGTLTTLTAYLSGAGEQVTDPKGNVTTTYYQVFDEPSYKDPVQVNAPGGITQTIVRDIYGNPKSITQSGLYGTENDSVTKTLTYDSYYRLCATSEPESGSTLMGYDAANNLSWSLQGQPAGSACVTTAPTGATARTYDEMNRVKLITPPAGTQTTSYQYDARGNIYNVVSGSATNTFGYNSRNLLTTQTLSVGNYAWGIGYNYDSYGHVNAIGYPAYNGSGEGVAYSPDALGRATQAGSYANGITYFPNNQVSGFNFGNGASYVAQQNTRQLLSNFSYGTSSALKLSEDFIYDNNGNITNVNDLLNNGQRTKAFTYDALNRLTGANAANLYGAESYTYDALNNLRTRLTGGNTLTLSYDPATNRLQSVAQNGSVTTQYTYDAQGNRYSLASGGNTTYYNFDVENQLLQIPGLESYAYDAAGRRVTKTTASGAVSAYYFYDQAGQLMYEFDPATVTGTNYIYLGTKLIAKHAMIQLGAPGALSASSNPNNGNFTLNWGASSDATSYTLQESINNGAWNTIYSGASTSATLSGRAGGSYTYQVQACLSGSCSGWTSSSVVGVWPAIPTVTVPTGTDNGPYTISWSASPSATGYTVQESVNGGAWTTIATNTTATSIDRPGNVTGSYTYQVEASNSYGTAGWSATSAAVAVNTAFGVVPAPTPTLTVPSTSYTGSVTISWTAASPVTGYTLQQSSNGGATWATVYSDTGTSVALTGLASGSYTYQLQACNTSGGGNVCTGYVTAAAMVVTLPPTGVSNVSAPGLSSTGSYTVSWSSVAAATSYTLQQQVNGGSWTTIQSSGATSWNASGEGDATYGYRVQACNVGGCAGWSSTGTTVVDLPPGAPSLSGGGTSNNGSYALSWGAVATATSYTLQESVNGGAWTTVQSSAATSWSTSGRGNGTYYYHVQACDQGGCSGLSNQATETVALIPVTPTLTVKQTSTGTMIIATTSWTAEPYATSYTLQELTGSTVSQMYSGSGTSWSGSYAYGALRSFRVQACDSSGCSPWSNWTQ